MKVGLITNLVFEDKFVQKELGFCTSEKLLSATGGNTGNVAFVHSVKTLLSDEFGIVHWGDSPSTVKRTYDVLCICCANQVGAHVDLGVWAEKLEQFGLPVILVGLGAQSDKIGTMPTVPEGTVKFLNVVSHLNPSSSESNIITRGEFSSWVLSELGVSSSPLGCPSLLASPRLRLGDDCLNKKRELSKNFRVMVPAGNPWHKSSIIENSLLELVSEFEGEYVLQHPDLLFKVILDGAELDSQQKDLLEKVYSFLGGIEDIKSWLKAYSVFFADANNWMSYSRKFSFAIGPRYHGVALPVQVGVPGRVITIDSRTEELANTTGIPYVSYEKVVGMSQEELVSLCKWDKSEAEHFDQVRYKNSSGYVEFFDNNGLRLAEHVKRLGAMV